MRLRYLTALASLMAIVLLTACSNSSTKTNFDNVDEQVSDNAFDSTNATTTAQVSSGNADMQTTASVENASVDTVSEETQGVGKAVLADAEESAPEGSENKLEIVNTDRGDWLKTPNGYKLKLKDTGDYIVSDMLEVGDYTYYFNEDGYLQTSLFVSNGGKDWYIQNCKKVYGFIDVAGNTYYIDAEKGVLKACSAKIDGEAYWFDRDGKSITKEEFGKLSDSAI